MTEEDYQRNYIEKQLIRIASERNLDWSKMSDDEKESLIDDIIHENRYVKTSHLNVRCRSPFLLVSKLVKWRDKMVDVDMDNKGGVSEHNTENQPSKTVFTTKEGWNVRGVKSATITDQGIIELSPFWVSYKELISCFSYYLIKYSEGEDYEGIARYIKSFSDYIQPVFVVLSPIRYEIDSYDELYTKFTRDQMQCLLNTTSVIEHEEAFKEIVNNKYDVGVYIIQIILEDVLNNFESYEELPNKFDEMNKFSEALASIGGTE